MILRGLQLCYSDRLSLPERKAIINEEWCISSYLMRLLPHGRKEGLRGRGCKIVVFVGSTIKHYHTIVCSGICDRYVLADIQEVLTETNPIKKKEWYLSHLLKGVLIIAKEEGWPESIFHNAADKIRSLGYINEWQWKKAIWNKSHSIKLIPICKLDLDVFTLHFVLYDNNDNYIGRYLLLQTRPDSFAYKPLMKDIRWIDNNTVVLLAAFDNIEVGQLDCQNRVVNTWHTSMKTF